MDSGNGESIGEFVSRIRREKGLTVQAVSERSGKDAKGNNNISPAYVNKIENESPNISAPKLDALAKGLGVTRAEIYAIAYKIDFDINIANERFSKIANGYADLGKQERDSIEPLLTAIELTIDRAPKNTAKVEEETGGTGEKIPLSKLQKDRDKKLTGKKK